MDNLTSLRDRIAAVLVDHAAAEYSWGVDGCECGFKASDLMEQAAHQADAVIEALRLHRNDEEEMTDNFPARQESLTRFWDQNYNEVQPPYDFKYITVDCAETRWSAIVTDRGKLPNDQ